MKLKTILISACVMFMANYATSQVVYQKDGKIYMEFGKYNEFPKNSIDYKTKITGATPSNTTDYWGSAVTGSVGTNKRPYWKLEIDPGMGHTTTSNWSTAMTLCLGKGAGWRLPLVSELVTMQSFRKELVAMGVTFHPSNNAYNAAIWSLNEGSATSAYIVNNDNSLNVLLANFNAKVDVLATPRCVREVPVGE